MLRTLVTIALLTVCASPGLTQTLFLDSLKETTWITDQRYDDPSFRTEWDIFLQKWKAPVDSLNTSVTVWQFGEELTLSYYNAKTRKDKQIKTYPYQVDRDKGRLIIQLSEKETLTYEVGITSTGNTAGLYKMKKNRRE
jgi:hypothetical protein